MSMHDETAATYFKSGWDAAIREVSLQRQHDRLDEFMNEQLPQFESRERPADAEAHGT